MPRRKEDFQQGPTTLWLLDQLEKYLEFNDMDNDGCSLSRLIADDRSLIQRLRDGGDISITKMDDALAFMQGSHVVRIKTSEGLVETLTLKPFTIEPRSIP